MAEKIYHVKADADPEWQVVRAQHAWAAAAAYAGWCVVRPGDRVVLTPEDIIEVRLGDKKVRVPKKVVMQWATWKAEQNIEERQKREQERKQWRDPRAGPR